MGGLLGASLMMDLSLDQHQGIGHGCQWTRHGVSTPIAEKTFE